MVWYCFPSDMNSEFWKINKELEDLESHPKKLPVHQDDFSRFSSRRRKLLCLLISDLKFVATVTTGGRVKTLPAV